MSLHYSHHRSNNKMLSIRVLLISTTVLSMALMLKLSMPVIAEFTLSDLPTIWSFLISWLRPPYLYVVINCIIITIVASSRLQSKSDFDQPPLLPPETATLLQTVPVKKMNIAHGDLRMDYAAAVYDSVVPKSILEMKPEFESNYYGTTVVPKSEPVLEMKPEFENNYSTINFIQVPEPDLYVTEDVSVPETEVEIAVNALEDMKIVNEFMILKPERSIPKNESTIRREKPPVSARFGHRKSIKASPEGGRTLGVAKPKRQDTLESTWKTITEGRPMPLTRHLKKSDTWETQSRHHNPTTTQDQQKRMTKSETFNVSNPQDQQKRMNKSETFNVSNPPSLSRSTGSGKLKKDPSLGQEELNKRVEAFIKKFNEDMRLQRQESLNQYMEMINRGAH